MTHGFAASSVATRLGVSVELLRRWESRYRVVSPVRDADGRRRYSAADVARLERMVSLIANGMQPRDAASAVLADAPVPESNLLPTLRVTLVQALVGLDEATAQDILDRAVAVGGMTGMLAHVALPVMRDIGDRWEAGTIGVGEEHFASVVIRGRLLALLRGSGGGAGDLALLACAEGERHDIGLLAFGLVLRERGWRLITLGADTPCSAIEAIASRVPPRVAVLAGTLEAPLRSAAARLRLPPGSALAVGGPAAAALSDTGAAILPTDLIAAVAALP